jgi:hypothetical protein
MAYTVQPNPEFLTHPSLPRLHCMPCHGGSAEMVAVNTGSNLGKISAG